MSLKVSDQNGNIKFFMHDDGTIPKQFFGYGGISSKDIQNFKIPQFGTLKLDAEEIKPTKLIQSVNVKVEFEHYKEPVIELNENNEVVVKVGKIQIGGCKQ